VLTDEAGEVSVVAKSLAMRIEALKSANGAHRSYNDAFDGELDLTALASDCSI